jgi:multiple sugar transport system permease protein
MWTQKTIRDTRDGYAFLAPYLLVVIVFLIYPMISGLWISLHEWAILGNDRPFVGFSNYVRLVLDDVFWKSLGNTLYFVLLSTPLLVVFGLLFAVFLNGNIIGKSFFRTAIFLPYLLSISVVGMLWLWLLQPRYGLLAFYLEKVPFFSNVNWLGNPKFAMPAVVMTTVWWTIGFNMVLFLAGLQDIPEELKDAAKIDGVGVIKEFWYITLPLLRRITLFVVIMQIIKSFQIFGQVFIMTGGGPYGATRVLVQYIYENGFKYWKMGYASAMAYVLLIIILFFTIFQLKIGEKNT